MKKIILLTSYLLLTIFLFAEKYPFQEVMLTGVENPVCITISPAGDYMIVVDKPKKGNLMVKQCYRPYLESKWGAAVLIDVINNKIDKDTRIDGPCFSFDNTRLYFSANFSDSKGGMDIYYIEKKGDNWSDPINFGGAINTELDENFPSVSGNNRVMYFTREEEMKKLEAFKTGVLFCTQKDDKTQEWKEPEKINTEINSGGLAYPKICDDNKTIFYSRVDDDKDGWKIHWIKKLNDIHWFLPVKFDTLVSKESEISPVFCKPESSLYYIVSNITSNNSSGQVYSYKLEKRNCPDATIKVKGNIINSVTNKPVEATVLVLDPVLNRTEFLTTSSAIDGSYELLLEAKQEYIVHIWKENFSHVYKLIASEEASKNMTLDFKIFPQAKVTLNMYDQEELWPIDGAVSVVTQNGQEVKSNEKFIYKGQKQLTLPIGNDYLISVKAKYYNDNKLELALSNIVLFDEFVRDIELVPQKRDVEIYVTDAQSNNPLEATVELFDVRKRTIIPNLVAGTIGLYQTSLREGEKFDVEVRGPKGFAFKHVSFDLAADRNLKRVSVQLQPLMRKVPIRLDNINFEFNSADLLEISFVELNRVVQLLKENPEIHVEIMAHTDDVGSDKYNNVLADKRAKSVVEYLIVNGINGVRLVAKGYGESMPLVANDTEENRAINRRVEMKILDENDENYMIEERIIEE